MQKKYIVRLSRTERNTLLEVVKKLKGSSQKVRRAQILLKADVNGSDWTDSHIAEAFGCRRQTVESIRQKMLRLAREKYLFRVQDRRMPTGLVVEDGKYKNILAGKVLRHTPKSDSK